MGINLDPEHLKRYKDIALLLVRYGNSDIVKNAGLEEVLTDQEEVQPEVSNKAENLAKDLEKLGPAFVKLGQLLSTRADLLPPAYLVALSRLQDNCIPFDSAEIERTVTAELGVRMSRAFQEFSYEPMAAASLSQVHRAVLRNGKEVAVKVQRPCIREVITRDLDILAQIAEFYDKNTEAGKKYQFSSILEEYRKTLLAELDLRKEAHNLEMLSDNLRELDRIVVPLPVPDYTTSRILTMDFIRGKKVTSVTQLELLELDGAELSEQVFQAYLKQILVDGFFHADPHPGNVFLTEDKKVALIDLGMVARITQSMQGKLLQLLLGISEGRADAVANKCIDIGEPTERFDEITFRKQLVDLVQNYLSNNLTEMQIGKVILGVTKSAADCGIRVPSELTMLGKTLLNLDQVGRTLDPTFDPNASVRRNALHIMHQRMLAEVSPGKIFTGISEAKDFLEKFPTSFNRILDLIAGNKLQVKVIDEPVLIDAAQKVANRISLALVLAALIIGAALLMDVPTSFRILGYPGFAIICFVMAASGGFALAFEIMVNDDDRKKLMGNKPWTNL